MVAACGCYNWREVVEYIWIWFQIMLSVGVLFSSSFTGYASETFWGCLLLMTMCLAIIILYYYYYHRQYVDEVPLILILICAKTFTIYWSNVFPPTPETLRLSKIVMVHKCSVWMNLIVKLFCKVLWWSL